MDPNYAVFDFLWRDCPPESLWRFYYFFLNIIFFLEHYFSCRWRNGRDFLFLNRWLFVWFNYPAISGHSNTSPVLLWGKTLTLGLWISLRYVNWKYLIWNETSVMYFWVNWVPSEHSIRTVVVFLILSITVEREETEQKFESEQNFIFYIFLEKS